jgi:hypothetical protein
MGGPAGYVRAVATNAVLGPLIVVASGYLAYQAVAALPARWRGEPGPRRFSPRVPDYAYPAYLLAVLPAMLGCATIGAAVEVDAVRPDNAHHAAKVLGSAGVGLLVTAGGLSGVYRSVRRRQRPRLLVPPALREWPEPPLTDHVVEIMEVRPSRRNGDGFATFLDAMCTHPDCTWSATLTGTLGSPAEQELRETVGRHARHVTISEPIE